MQGEKHHINWEQDWLEGKISSQEAEKLASNASEFHSLDEFVQRASALGVGERRSKEEAWARLEEKINSAEKTTKVIPINRRVWLTGVAASFIIALGAFFLLDRPETVSVDTALAELKTVYLPDSSIVYMNGESQISYSADAWDEKRNIQLSGEAFFEVKRGKNFTVTTDNGSVEVLGTSFNVRSRNSVMTVACKTGKVRVSNQDQSKQEIITPGLAVVINKQIMSDVMETSLSRVDIWRRGEFDYESLPLSEVLSELIRLYRVEVEHDFDESEMESPISGTYKTNDLKDAVQTIAISKGRNFNVSEDGKNVSFVNR